MDQSNSHQYFNEISGQWDQMQQSFFSHHARNKAYELANIQEGFVIGDIGAGTGYMSEGLKNMDVQLIAVDQSEAMLSHMQQKFSAQTNFSYKVGSSDHLPIPDNTLDVAFANMYLHHVDDPAVAVKELARVLKPGGKVIITDLDQHSHKFLVTEQHDRWMGFLREDLSRWFQDADLCCPSVTCVGDQCCSRSDLGTKLAEISIFIAHAKKPYN